MYWIVNGRGVWSTGARAHRNRESESVCSMHGYYSNERGLLQQYKRPIAAMKKAYACVACMRIIAIKEANYSNKRGLLQRLKRPIAAMKVAYPSNERGR